MKLHTLTLTALLALPVTAHATQDVFCEHLSGLVGTVYQMQDQGFALRDIRMALNTQCQLREDYCLAMHSMAEDVIENPPQWHEDIQHPGHFAQELTYHKCIVDRIQSGKYGTGEGF